MAALPSGPPTASLDLRPVPFTHPDAVSLIDEVQGEYVRRYGGPDETPLDPSMFEGESGRFFVGYLEDLPVTMGGWRLRTDVAAYAGRTVAEVKRMYVSPTARRRGLAREVLACLEQSARETRAVAMVLETGLKQPEAITLYESSGYEPVEPFGYYKTSPTARYYGKPL